MFKKLLIIFLVVVVLAAVGVYLAFAWGLNAAVKTAVEEGMPPVTSTDVKLAQVDLSPFSGKGELSGFVIGNPKGYKTESLFKINSLKLAVDTGSVFQEVKVIQDISISGAEITFEVDLAKRKSNLTVLQENIEASFQRFGGAKEGGKGEGKDASKGEKPSGQGEDAAGAEGKGAETKVIIDRFLLENCTVRLALTASGGKAASLTLPRLELTGIGRKSGGETAREAAAQIIKQVTLSVNQAIANNPEFIKQLGDNLPDAVKSAGDAAIDKLGEKVKLPAGTTDKLKEQLGKESGKLKGLLGK